MEPMQVSTHIRRFVDPNEAMCQLKHVVSKGDDDELRRLCLGLDIIGNNRHVLEVQRGINLVHEVQRRGLQSQLCLPAMRIPTLKT